MKRLSIILFFLITGTIQAAPVVDPLTYFQGWPWTNITGNTQTWYYIEKNNHIIKQLWYCLRDRCEAAGRPDLPYLYENKTVAAGIKTNYSYTYVTNWHGTDITVTNWPTLQMQMNEETWNAITNFTYLYPSNCGSDYSGLVTKTGGVFVTETLLDTMKSTIENICQFYIPSQATNLPAYFNTADTNGVYPNDIQHFCMAGLMEDAGYAITNRATNIYGVVTNGGWSWLPMPSGGSTNVILTLSALDQIAACVAQLRMVGRGGECCSPMLLFEMRNIGAQDEFWGWDGGAITYNYYSSTNFKALMQMPFAWEQCTTYDWTGDFTYDNSWNMTNDVDITLTYRWILPDDWPLSGFPSKATATYDFTVTGSLWPFFVEQGYNWKWVCDWGSSLSSNSVVHVQGSFSLLGSPPTNGSVNITESFASIFTWEEVQSVVHTYNWNMDVFDNSSYQTYYNIYTNLQNITTASNYEHIITWGKYLSKTAGVVTVTFTNEELFLNYTKFKTNIINQTESNLSSIAFATNLYDTGTSSTGTVWVGTPQTTTFITNNGSLSITLSDWKQGVQARTCLYSVRAGGFQYSTNLTGTAKLYAKGGGFVPSSIHGDQTSSAHSEWTDGSYGYTWDFSSIYEKDLTGGSICLTNNRWTGLKTVSIPSGVDNGQIIYKDMPVNANAHGYIPFLGTTSPRKFWGITNFVWGIDYVFEKHF